MRDQLPHNYDHAWLLGQIVDGYYRTEMSTTRRDTDNDAADREALERRQEARARAEERFARDSETPAEERVHERRADRATYLAEKLAEAERSER